MPITGGYVGAPEDFVAMDVVVSVTPASSWDKRARST
jgi:hypothetical protein